MPTKDGITIYTTPSLLNEFELNMLDINTISLPIQKMAKKFMEEGEGNDICVMPYVTQYKSLLTTFRSKKLYGPVLFLSDEPVDYSIAYDIHKQGAILIDIRQQQKDFVKLTLVFILENQKLMKSSGLNQPLSENEMAVQAIQSLYPQKIPEPETLKPEPPDFSDSKKVQSVLAEVLEQPEVLDFNDLYSNRELFESKFSFNLDVTRKKDKKKLSFSCISKLHRVNAISPSTKKRMMYFTDFHPDFSVKFFRRMITQVAKEDIAKALRSRAGDFEHEHMVECLFNLDGVNRTCFLLPALKKSDEVIGFIPVSNAFVQNRQFFRIEPSEINPVTALVASTLSATQNVSVIDVSERGISFYSEYLYKKNSEISVSLSWEKVKLVCHGIIRFTKRDDETGKNIIGVELYLHQDERGKLRKYVFNCQIEVMKTLREEYS